MTRPNDPAPPFADEPEPIEVIDRSGAARVVKHYFDTKKMSAAEIAANANAYADTERAEYEAAKCERS